MLGDRTEGALGARVVDGHVEAAEARDGPLDHRANVLFLADVGLDEFGLRTEGAELLDEFRTRFLAPARHDHDRAFPGEGDGGGAANTRQAAGDQNDISIHDKLAD